MKYFKLNENDFAKLFNVRKESLPAQCREIIKNRNFRYRKVNACQRDEIITAILKKIDSNTLSIAGPHRQPQWESGWNENLREYIKTRDNYSLTPKFIKPEQPLRLNRDFVVPSGNRFEFDFVDVLRRWLFLKYFKNQDFIYEFGCGSCQHLVVLCELFPGKRIFGLDWAASSIRIVNKLAQFNKCDLKGKQFNLLKPDYDYKLSKDCAIFTVGTLEQLGTDFEPFLKYLLKNDVSLCVHLETIQELYSQDNLVDYLALKFNQQRKYLDGFLTRLEKLQSQKKVKILKVQRISFGSLYQDSYSLVVWKPI